MPKVFLKTYGCQMNERDSEQVLKMLLDRGYEHTTDEMQADVILLNTCSVRDMAEQKAIGKMGMLGRMKRERPQLVMGFLGCMAQSRGAELLRDVPGTDLVVGTAKFHRVADYVDDLVRRRRSGSMDDLRASIVDVGDEEGSQNTIRDHTLEHGQCTAFVSIMQGCNMHCTFCIVPSTRGAERGRPIAEIVAEVRELAQRGVREVTLLGQIVNQYGRHELPKIGGKSPFVQLLEAVHEVDGIERIRFTSPHPMGFRDDLVQAFAELPKLVEHIHLPVQSGSDRILKAMRRPYTNARYRDLVARLRTAQPKLAITTDIIVGFPGESDADYAATRQLVEDIAFDNAFVFKYSKRRGTPAAEMPDQVPEEVKVERNHDLLSLVNAISERITATYVGKHVEILCEGPSKTNKNRLSGRTRTNKIVVFEGPRRLIGKIFDVRIEHASPFTLYGDPILLDPATNPSQTGTTSSSLAR